jgi:hypothetical protein
MHSFVLLPITILTVLTLLISSTFSAPQYQPKPPPDACYRRNDSMAACPYGGTCFPNQAYTCQTSCIDFRAIDSRFFCTLSCAYHATTLRGDVAPNPLLCLQPTRKNGFTCDSGWACYRKFGTRAPFRTQGPVCSPPYPACNLGNVSTIIPTNNGTNATTTAESECSVGNVCIEDPRWELARPTVPEQEDPPGLCVPEAKTCSGKKWDECGDTQHCVANPKCKGKLGKDCRGLCVKILGDLWGTVNATDLKRRSYRSALSLEGAMC